MLRLGQPCPTSGCTGTLEHLTGGIKNHVPGETAYFSCGVHTHIEVWEPEKVIYLAWENYEDNHNRVLHIFKGEQGRVKYFEFLSKNPALTRYSAQARYPARAHEVKSHDADLVAYHTEDPHKRERPFGGWK